MKKLALMMGFLFTAGNLFAGSIDYLSNQSADYMRTFSRNASTDTDAVHFNPAGTALMKDGIYLYLSGQYIDKTYSGTREVTDTKYESTEPSIIPNFYAVYKKDKYSAMIGAGPIAGGGKVKFEDGVPLLAVVGASSGNVEATIIYYSASLGGAYSLNDSLSVSAQARYVNAQKTFKGETNSPSPAYQTLDAEKNAQGVGIIFGVDFKMDKMLFAARFETPTILKFETTVHDGKSFGTTFTDGKKERYDLPAMAALGFSFDLNPFVFTTSADIFFIGLSDKKDASETSIKRYDDDYAKVGYEISASVEYIVIPKFLKVSTGYMYNRIGGNQGTYNDFDFSLNSHSVGLGGRVMPIENLAVVFAVSRIMYVSSDGYAKNGLTTGGKVKYQKDAWVYSLGVDYKI